jgi:hypothetical protein
LQNSSNKKTSIVTQSSGAIPPPLTQISALLNSSHCWVHRKIYCKTPEQLSRTTLGLHFSVEVLHDAEMKEILEFTQQVLLVM